MPNRNLIFWLILVRAIIGIAIIFFVNEFLASKGISAQVGMNPVTF